MNIDPRRFAKGRSFIRRPVALGLLTTTLSILPPASAEEGGTGHYLPGGMATLIDLLPLQAGWLTEAIFLHYEGEISARRQLPVAGLIASDLEGNSDALTLGVLYTLKPQALGAYYTLGAFAPYVWMDTSARISRAGSSRKIFRSDRVDGIGDLSLIPAMLAWKLNEWQFNGTLSIYAPTGDYQVGRLANSGLNHWTIDPTFGAAYQGKIGFNGTVFGGFAFSTENLDTNYRNGTVFHLDGSVQQLLPLGPGSLGLGVEAFYYQQLDADRGSGVLLDDFKSRTTGLGPVLSYFLPVGDNNLAIELRWLTELDTAHRLEGDYLWFKVVYQF